jgi:hypothetical protein
MVFQLRINSERRMKDDERDYVMNFSQFLMICGLLTSGLLFGQAAKAPAAKPAPAPIAPAKKALIDRLLAANSHNQQVNQAREGMTAQFSQRLQVVPIPDTLKTQMTTQFRAEVGKADFTRPIVQAYADNYSDTELLDMIKFYESSTGKKMLQQQAQFATLTMQMSGGVFGSAAQAVFNRNKAAIEASSKAPAPPGKK